MVLIPGVAKKIFNCFSLCLSSNKRSVEYLRKLNANSISFSGNLKLIGKIDKNTLSS